MRPPGNPCMADISGNRNYRGAPNFVKNRQCATEKVLRQSRSCGNVAKNGCGHTRLETLPSMKEQKTKVRPLTP